MKRLLLMIATLCVLVLTGCAATVQSSEGIEQPLALSSQATSQLVLLVEGNETSAKSEDWQEFRALWDESMKIASQAQGIGYTWAQDATANSTDPGTLVTVTVNDYRFVSQGARLGLGIMIGNAFVDADALFSELPAEKAVGKRTFKTTSSAGHGIFAAMTAKQVQAICDEIVKLVLGAK